MADPYKPRAPFTPWDRRQLPGTFDVEETTADGGGWTCDHEAHSVTVDVSGNADGSLSAVVTTPATISACRWTPGWSATSV